MIDIKRTPVALYTIVSVVAFVISFPACSQFNNDASYQFLHVPVSARMSALGGVNVSLADRDVNFFYSNPALNGDTLSGMASINYQFYVADIGHAAVTYAHTFKRVGMLTLGVQHMDYGAIKGYDASGQEMGIFRSQETALVISKSHQVRHYRFAASVRSIFSNYAGFRSAALTFDLGGTFIHPEKPLSVGLVVRNVGFVISDFSESADSAVPFDVQAGVTFKPEFMPLRFSIAAFNLAGQKTNRATPAGGPDDDNILQDVLSHFNFGTEVLLHRNVQVLIGYNYWKHRELKLENGGGGAGLSVGLSANVKSIDFIVSRAGYVAGNATYSFTLSSDINKYLKRRSI